MEIFLRLFAGMMAQSGMFCHKICKTEFTSKLKLQQAKDRKEKEMKEHKK